jgi:hypothetical protein
MKEYVVYKIDLKMKSGTYSILSIPEAFRLMEVNDHELPKLKQTNDSINIPELERLMLDRNVEMIRLVYQTSDWIISKISN